MRNCPLGIECYKILWETRHYYLGNLTRHYPLWKGHYPLCKRTLSSEGRDIILLKTETLSSGKRDIILWETGHYPLWNGTFYSLGNGTLSSGILNILISGKRDIILWDSGNFILWESVIWCLCYNHYIPSWTGIFLSKLFACQLEVQFIHLLPFCDNNAENIFRGFFYWKKARELLFLFIVVNHAVQYIHTIQSMKTLLYRKHIDIKQTNWLFHSIYNYKCFLIFKWNQSYIYKQSIADPFHFDMDLDPDPTLNSR